MSETQNVKIILDIIKNLILLEDYVAIKFHVRRLNCDGDARLTKIVQRLNEENYSKAVKLIDEYFNSISIEKVLSDLQSDKAKREIEEKSERFDESCFKKAFLIAVIVAVIMILGLILMVKKHGILHDANISADQVD